MSRVAISEMEIAVPARGKPVEMTVLIFAAEPAASGAALRLQRDLGARVQVVSDTRPCQEAFQREQFTLVILEESLARLDPEGADLLYRLAGEALVMEINFGTTAPDRMLRQVGPALRRRNREAAGARAVAARTLYGELNGVLTGLLMEAELALRQAGPGMAPALARIVDLVENLGRRLQDVPKTASENASEPNLHHR